MDLILDTNALSAAAEGDPEIAGHLANADRVLIPVIVLGEYRFGISQSRKRAQHERWLAEMVAGSMVLEIGDATASHYADIRGELKTASAPIPSNDLWIAALCRQYRTPLLSRDRHFDRIRGVQRVPSEAV